jgi:hypothetical protein
VSLAGEIVAHVKADAGLVAACGGRIYPLTLPQHPTLPALTYQRIDGPREVSHTGDSGLEHPRYQFDCWATTYLEAEALATAMMRAFAGQLGWAVGFPEAGPDDYESDTARYRRTVDVLLWVRG